MEPLTLFTWGYWGWGTATDQLVQAVDAVEASRGYEPPLFVDIRISRSVRAPGFNGRAFERTVGSSRYRWLDALGNLAIRDGGSMRIKDPAAADTLLDIAATGADSRKRVLLFCSCEFPGVEGNGCHRATVARLVLKAASRRKLPTKVVEWPGGEPRPVSLGIELSQEAFDKVRRGSTTSVPLQNPVQLAAMAGLPWCSLVAVRPNIDDSAPPLLLLSGPARYKKGGWYLPIYENIDPELSPDGIRRRIQELRKGCGFVERSAKL